jgi:hypothetical protein
MSDSLYCVLHGRGNEWEGLCLDLDLAVHGKSLSEVKDLMKDAVETYVQDARKEDEPTRRALLNRRAPLRVRAYWAMRIAMATLRGRNRDNDLPVGYPVPCHV